MKKIIYFSVVFSLVSVLCGADIPLKVKLETPWKAENGTYTLDYSGKLWPKLILSFPAQKGKTYKFSCEVRLKKPVKRMEGLRANPGKEFAPYTHYIYAKADTEKISINLNPGEPNQLQVRNCKVEEMTALPTENLIWNGDFENASFGNVFMIGSWADQASGGRWLASPDFLYGEKSLQIPMPVSGKVNSLVTPDLPVRSNGKVKVTFWAKADKPQGLTVQFDFLGQFKKHLYYLKTFNLNTEWQEYTMEYDIPELQRPLVRLCFSRKHAPGAVWLDMVDLRVE
ncbi:MAG: hypothetical protein J6C40_07010 [Lentisphaeria bacterium]|nr:hypothetical protein [Lentisphaeria bacterium]